LAQLSYGGERYEKRSLQQRVRKRFEELQAMDEAEKRIPWHIVNAAQSVEEVQADINKIVESTLQNVNNGAPLYKMFQEGVYQLPEPNK
jgi:dTMP kinase